MSALLALIAVRSVVLLAALLAALALGGPVAAILPLHLLKQHAITLAATLGRKLNRSRRDVATRAWRGVIVLGILLLPAMLLGWVIAPSPAGSGVLLFVMFALALRANVMWPLWRQARKGTIALQTRYPHHLFPDSHAVLRYRILEHSRHFAVGVVGVGFWFLALGPAGALGYLALALAAGHYSDAHDETQVFGSVARALFSVADFVPHRLTAFLLVLAGFFVPGSRSLAALPLAMRTEANWPRFIATLVDVSLGGPTPVARRSAQLPWVGTGTAQLHATHVGRWLAIWGVACLGLALLVMPALFYANPLK